MLFCCAPRLNGFDGAGKMFWCAPNVYAPDEVEPLFCDVLKLIEFDVAELPFCWGWKPPCWLLEGCGPTVKCVWNRWSWGAMLLLAVGRLCSEIECTRWSLGGILLRSEEERV